jgi:hypothetical protein
VHKVGERTVEAVAHVALATICAVTLLTQTLNPVATVGAQVVSAIAGARLGIILQRSVATDSSRQLAHVSVRQLLDHAQSLGRVVSVLDGYRSSLDLSAPNAKVNALRVDEWLDGLDGQLRDVLNSTQTAVANWNDLSPGVAELELAQYLERSSMRLRPCRRRCGGQNSHGRTTIGPSGSFPVSGVLARVRLVLQGFSGWPCIT